MSGRNVDGGKYMERDDVLNELGQAIRETMNSIMQPVFDSEENFDNLKKIALYTSEFIEDDVIKEEYKKQLKNSEKDANLIDVKLETFKMIRNVLVHFPYYKKWEDVFITPEMLIWNKSWSTIKNYFEENKGKNINYNVYIRDGDGEWQYRHTVNATVPEMVSNTKLYLKDFLSIEDVFWTFGLIDSMLEYLNVGILSFSHYSI